MKVYKLFRVRNGKLYPLYVEAKREMPVGVWLQAQVGEKADETHVKASGCGGKLALRPGFHSTKVPYTDWIGKRTENGTLIQRADTVWCECEIRGEEQIVTARYGLRTLPDGYYRYRTNAKQRDPWIISRELKIVKILSNEEVDQICEENGFTAQEREVSA